ncbi:type II toxin-antitoxin system death-on-curing family toxin [Cyanobium sp. AMD-g]|uniref:type II toxin-antitoxin system death-on-curing family toxin n=1 Tax=Cyanobium sp. AMD-g TaxID=2823699 RepID=UPI0020CFC805|nr:type II toxin-antitoxin system death-on-curing family toxin [Cyanobium sp. AMD-g]MCP9931172.1 type II toxin-antitoxin system death-on-curing family toxin [Cyanobium sp. AMD-g]
MAEPRWLPRLVIEAVHLDQLREHGGLRGLRDEHALEAALARPRQRWNFEPESDLATLAAAYAFGLVKAHAFHDGNKRTAFLAAVIFLGLNGVDLVAEEEAVVQVMLALAAGECSERALETWLRSHLQAHRG